MTVYLVMGGQAGSEGKGEFVAYLASRLQLKGTLGAVVRTGGPNAGHTMTTNGDAYKMRQVPCAWHLPQIPLFIAAGSLIDQEVLDREVSELSVGPDRLEIDPAAIVITDADREAEVGLVGRIGSTGEGIGGARSRHIMRDASQINDTGLSLGKLTQYISKTSVSKRLNSIYDSGQDIIIESTQGFDLSLMHSGHYPHTTSRDATPGQILSDAGLSSRVNHRVISVVRTFPIRVAGNSGPMADEITWGDLEVAEEHTTVTGKVRRVGRFDADQVSRMVEMCRPDSVCLTFLDYLYPSLASKTGAKLILSTARETLLLLEQLGACVKWASTGPGIITEIPTFLHPHKVV
jgi:adenylosuccinate synthase